MKRLASVFQDLRKQVAPLLKSFQGEVRARPSRGALSVASRGSLSPAGCRAESSAGVRPFCVPPCAGCVRDTLGLRWAS